jgi:glycosyltransferase involved in cell wall biosynthesis
MSERIEGGNRLFASERLRSPLVSIITVVFRAREELLPLIESVCRHESDSIEFIIIDGGSTDGTVELLREHERCIDYWLSEPDQGIYDAMNKAIALANGEFLLHLNAGDALLAIPEAELWSLSGDVDVAAFRVSVDGNEFRPASGLRLRHENTLHHQGTFYRRRSFLKYNTLYRVFADFDVNQRLAMSGARMKLFDKVVALHAGGGASDTANVKTVAEHFCIIRRNHGVLYLFPAWLLCKYQGFTRRIERFGKRPR